MELEHVVFLETACVDEHVDALTRRVFAAGVLLLDSFFAAAKTSLLALGEELFDFLYLLAHNIMILD